MDTDIALLADESARFLVAFLPYLAPIGQGAAGEMGARAADGAVGLAKKLWLRIRGDLPEPERIEDAASLKPDEGPAIQQELTHQLLQALTADPTLVNVLREILGHPNSQPTEQNIGVQQTGTVFGGIAFGIGKQHTNPTP